MPDLASRRAPASVGRWTTIVAFVALLALGLAIHRDYGISFDEGSQRIIGAVTVKYVAELLAPSLLTPSLATLEPLATFADRDYGVGFEAPAVVLEAILRLSDKREIFFVRHLLTFLACLAGAWALYGLALRRFGGRGFGLLAVAFLVLSPRQFAESFYNSKDMVFMAAFTLSLYSMFAFTEKPDLTRALVHALASAFALDLRLVAIVIPLMTAILLIVAVGRRGIGWQRGASIAGLYLAATALFLYALWPWLWANPIDRFVEAVGAMSRFRWQGLVLYLGRDIDPKALPWHYLPVWIAITTPPLYLLLFVIGVGGLVVRTCRERFRMLGNRADIQDVVIAGMVLAPVLAVIALRPVLYDGWRHFYFIYPCFVLLAVRGWEMIWTARWITSPGRVTLAVVTAALLSWNAWWMVRAHPHQNVYFNELAGGDLRARFELDYWGLGTRAALEYILQHDPADRVRVKAGSFLPLTQSLAMLTPDERRRIEVVTDDTGPHYLLNNFRSVGSATDAQYRKRYDLIHEIKAADLPILEIYRSR